MFKYVFGLLLITLFSASAVAGSDLHIQVLGLNSDVGRVRMGLYDSPQSFMKEKRAITIREAVASNEGVTFVIKDLPAGQYAVHLYHDKNRDRNFDYNFGLLFSEGSGVSGKVDDSGRASFENSVFNHNGKTVNRISVQVLYKGKQSFSF